MFNLRDFKLITLYYIQWLKKAENEWNIVWTRSIEGDKVKEEIAEKVDESTEIQSDESDKTSTSTEKATENRKKPEGLNDAFQRRRASEAALDVVERLVSSAGAECAALWTRAGRLFRLTVPASPDENCPEMRLQAFKQR